VSANKPESSPDDNLARHSVPFIGSLAQSVGMISPSGGIGIIMGAIFSVSGALAWMSWLVGTIAIGFVAIAIVFLSRRFGTTGGLYPLAAKVGGPAAGFFVAFGALVWLIVAAPALIIQAGIFFEAFLDLPGLGIAPQRWILLVVCLATIVGAGWVAGRGVKLSMRVLLVIDAVTLAMLLILMIVTLVVHPGGPYDPAEFSFKGLGVSSIILGITFVTFSFGGFESATILGEEAQDGKRTIPLAVIGSVLIVGVFLAFSEYAMVLGFSGTKYNLATSSSAIPTLALIDGLKWYTYPIALALVVAVFSGNVALYNVGARILYTLGRERLLPGRVGSVSSRTHTPLVGVLVFGVVNLIGVILVVIFNFNVVTAFDDLGTVSGYGALVMYGVTALAVAWYATRRASRVNPWFAIVPLCGAAIIAYGLYTDFVPFPAFPGSVLVYTFAGMTVCAIILYAVLSVYRRNRLAGLGSAVEVYAGQPVAERATARGANRA
jgi:amino acid transporter